MSQPDFERAREYVLMRLEQELPPNLFYHGIHHTRDDVLPAVARLAAMARLSKRQTLLLKTAALYHDIGFIEQYEMNEPVAIRIASETLPSFGYDPKGDTEYPAHHRCHPNAADSQRSTREYDVRRGPRLAGKRGLFYYQRQPAQGARITWLCRFRSRLVRKPAGLPFQTPVFQPPGARTAGCGETEKYRSCPAAIEDCIRVINSKGKTEWTRKASICLPGRNSCME